MVQQKSNEVIDLNSKKADRIIGVDIGTMNLVLSEQNKDQVDFSSIRNMYLPSDKDQVVMAELSNIDFVESDDSIFIVGQDAFNFSNIFGKQVKRPMSKGLISPSEIDSLDVLALIIEKLCGKTTTGKCLYSVPAGSIDIENNIVYHEGVFKRIFTNLGYTAEPFNEAMGIIYSQCQNEQFTGLAFSFGAGMCIRGDTKISLLNGEKKTIKELSELSSDQKYWVYSCKEDGTIVPGLAYNAHKVKTSKMIRIWLDNQKYLDCTEDHKIMMRDGSYKEAKNLKEKDSLMPLYLRDGGSDLPGYYRYYDNCNKGWKYVHRMVHENINDQIIPKNSVIHHWDFNSKNNDPFNLFMMTRNEHMALHGRCVNNTIERMFGKTFDEVYGCKKSKEIRQKMSNSMKKKWNENPHIFKDFINNGREWLNLIKDFKLEDIYGEKVANEIRHKMSIARKGKTFEELYGVELAKQLKKNTSELAKKLWKDKNFGVYTWKPDWVEKNGHTLFKKGQAPYNKGTKLEDIFDAKKCESIREKLRIAGHNQLGIYKQKREVRFCECGCGLSKEVIITSGWRYFPKHQPYRQVGEFKHSDKTKKLISEKVKNSIVFQTNMKIGFDKFNNDSERKLKRKIKCQETWKRKREEKQLMVSNHNHKVVRIEYLNEIEDVYDMTVDKYHNFAIDSGIFIHNCNVALSYKSVPVITFSVARAGDWIDEQSAMSLGTIPNRVTKIKESITDLNDFTSGNKKERRIREAIIYYYREMIRYSLDQIKSKLLESTDNLDLPESLSVVVSGGTSMAPGFIDLFKQVLSEYDDDLPIEIKDVRAADDPMTAVAEGLLIKALSKYSKD